jgi:hypothetical protein
LAYLGADGIVIFKWIKEISCEVVDSILLAQDDVDSCKNSIEPPEFMRGGKGLYQTSFRKRILLYELAGLVWKYINQRSSAACQHFKI